MTFVLRREWAHYAIDFYTPAVLLVALSWVSFWLDPSQIAARVTLGITRPIPPSTIAAYHRPYRLSTGFLSFSPPARFQCHVEFHHALPDAILRHSQSTAQ